MELLNFLESINLIENKEKTLKTLLEEGIENPTIVDFCSSIWGISSLEFLSNLSEVEIPKNYKLLVKNQLKIIIDDWNYYSDSINCDDYLTANNDFTEIYREYKMDEWDEDSQDYDVEKFYIKYEK